MNNILDTPWKFYNQIIRFLVMPYSRLLFALSGITWGRGWCFYGVPIIQKHRRSIMSFGPALDLRSTVHSNPLGPNHPVILCTWQAGAVLEIGANFGMTGGTICAAKHIKIGNNVAVGANTTIVDTDFHPVDPFDRKSHPANAQTAPIVINDDVFIGMNCIILKGVTIGECCVIGAGSVVTRDVPSGMIAAGNPAQIIRAVNKDKS